MATAVLLLGHGSRVGSANAEFEAFVGRYRDEHPELSVEPAYVELASPSLDEALDRVASTAERVIVLPAFLFAAGHVKNDVPLALARARRAHPSVEFLAARPLGVAPSLAAAVLERIAESARGAIDPERTTVVMVGRGSSDPDANGDFCKLARLVREAGGFAAVEPCFAGIAPPAFPDTAERVARMQSGSMVVVPYLLFGGRLVDRLTSQVEEFSGRYPWVPTSLSPHLGAHPSVLALLDERRREAVSGARPLPCDSCSYREPLPNRAHEAGGVRALLWSLRHTFTHTQATPHVHAHRALAKHVLVCVNVDCAGRGSLPLIDELRRRLKERGLERSIRVTRTACMGRCGEGPTVAVYPDGVWYRGVQASDASDLVEEHLVADRLVARLLDGVMQ